MLGISSLPAHDHSISLREYLSEYISHSTVQKRVLKFTNIFSLGMYSNQMLFLRFVIGHDHFSQVH